MRARLRFMLTMMSFTVAACGTRDASPANPLGESKDSGVVGRVLTCEAKDAAGNCIKKSCKEDSRGDCASYAKICIDADLHWNGTRHAGTCSKV